MNGSSRRLNGSIGVLRVDRGWDGVLNAESIEKSSSKPLSACDENPLCGELESELKLSTLTQSLLDFCVNVGELGGESKVISSFGPAVGVCSDDADEIDDMLEANDADDFIPDHFSP